MMGHQLRCVRFDVLLGWWLMATAAGMLALMVAAPVRAIDLHVPDAQRQWMRAEGAKHLTSMQNDTVMPLFGTCWRTALDHLDTTCAALTERSQAQLALRFARCFMDMTHGPEPPAPTSHRRAAAQQTISTAVRRDVASSDPDGDDGDDDESSSIWCARPDDHACMRRLPERHFAAFQQFFVHTAHVCYYVWGQRWHEAATEQLQQLHTASARVGAQMRVAASVQRTLLDAQRDGMRLQREAALRAAELGRALHAGGEEVRRLGGEWRRVAGEQGRVLATVFGQLHNLHGWLLAETAAAYRLFFWLGAATLCVLVTAVVRRTHAARWPALLLCCAGHWADGWVHSALQAFDGGAGAANGGHHIGETAVWWLRRTVLLAIVVLAVHLARGWRSETQRLTDTLCAMRSQNDELLERVRRLEGEQREQQRPQQPQPQQRPQFAQQREPSVMKMREPSAVREPSVESGLFYMADERRGQTPPPASGTMVLRSRAMRRLIVDKQ